jgi:nucleotide-binding universal stress UspA family protein
MCREAEKPALKVLIALDGSRDALLGVGYAARMLAGRKDVRITLFHVRANDAPLEVIREAFAVARRLLVDSGLRETAITDRQVARKVGTARDILEEIRRGGYGTVVIGRRGLTRAKQFLFGSVSQKVVQNARECAVWVVD